MPDESGDPRGKGALRDGPDAQQQPWPGTEAALQPPADHGQESYEGSGLLTGRRALVTGGDSGIGRAVAIAFAREGADVVIAYTPEEEADAAETLHWILGAGRRGVGVAGDLRHRAQCRELVARARAELGGVDVLVNNAAFQMERQDIAQIDEAQLERTFRTNIFAYFWMAQAVLEEMEAGGVILNTGSVTAMEGNAGLLDYSASKGAIHTFTRSLAQAVAERGIRVNCVAPGPVWTPLIPATLEPDHVARFGADTLWKRAAQPIEIATTYVFLASDAGRYYSGEVLSPTGRAVSR